MTKKPRITPSMRRVLENLAAGRTPTYGFASGRSTAGGLTGTFVALYSRGLIERRDNGRGDPFLTDAGRAVLA